MNTIVVTSTKQNIKFGYEGEDNVTKIIFPYDESWLEYGEGNFEVRILRCGDEVAYTATDVVDDRQAMTLTMTVTDIELSVRGRGEMQLCYVCPDSIKKSPIYQYTVNRSIDYKYAVDPPDGSIIASVEKSLSEIKNTTNRLSNSVISIESSIDDINSQIDNINDKISEFDEEIDSVGEIETKVDNLETSIGNISGRINTAEANINENAESISDLNESVTELENRKVTDLETSGGRSDSGKYLTVGADGKVKATSLTIPTITVDGSLSTTSENPVQNKVIKTELNNINSNIETCNTEISKINGSLENIYDSVSTDVYDLHSVTSMNSAPRRIVQPLTLENGIRYKIEFTISKFTGAGTGNSGLILTTLRSSTYTDKIEDIINIQKSSVNGIIGVKQELYFTPTETSSHLYTYANASQKSEMILDMHITKVVNIKDMIDDIGKTGNYTYSGQRISMEDYTYTLQSYMKTVKSGSLTWQGIDVHGDKLFRSTRNGAIWIYDLLTKSEDSIANFNLGSYGADNHAGNICFSKTFYNDNPDFPLLYVTAGDSSHAQCYVENVIVTDGVYSAETVQSITIDFSGFEGAGLSTMYPWCQWIVYNGYLYAVGHKTRANGTTDRRLNKHVLTKFPIPAISSASVTLTAFDVIEQIIIDYDYEFMQGVKIYNGMMFAVFGDGGSNPSAFIVYSLATHSAIAIINFTGTALAGLELESCTIYGGAVLISSTGNYIHRLEFA